MGKEGKRLVTSDKQLRANRLNSGKSTGPKSLEGKTISSKNSTTHGLLSKEVLLPWESDTDFESIFDRYFENLQPEGEIENLLVDRIVSTVWKLKRAGRTETGLIAGERFNLNAEIERSRLKRLGNFEPTILEMNILEIINRTPDLIELSLIFTKNMEALACIQRYESNLEKSLLKALHELQRIQAVRNGRDVPLPIVIDLDSDFVKEP